MKEEKSIEQLEQEFAFTLGKVSHEIRNPVALIHSFLQILEDKCPSVTETDCWEDIMENMDYLITLLNELSDYNNSKKLHLVPVYMDVFLEKIIASIQPTLDYLHIRLTARLAHPLPILEIDPIKLRQALLNLIRNAQEAMDSHGSLTLFGRCQRERFLLTVQDDGPGILPEDLDTIFDPFVTHKPGGSGLGLAIARQIVSAHGGTLQAESSPAGASFTLSLPLPSQDAFGDIPNLP